MNWYGAGFLGMVINTLTINYFTHGTQLIMPHGHAALLGAFGFEQGKIAHDMGYYFARLPDALNHMDLWKQITIIPDGLVILGAAIIFYDLVVKIYFPKKIAA